MSKQLKKPAPGVPYCVGCGAKGSYRCTVCANKERDAMHARLGTPPTSLDDDDDFESGLPSMRLPRKQFKHRKKR